MVRHGVARDGDERALDGRHLIQVFDEAGNEFEAHEEPRKFKELELRISISTNR